MRIGIVGGTGGMGEGFALRWCPKHDIVIGSRDAQKAKEAADIFVKEGITISSSKNPINLECNINIQITCERIHENWDSRWHRRNG